MGVQRHTPSIIVFGPQGCGKTLNAKVLAAHFGLKIIKDDATWPPNKAAWASFKARGDELWLVSDDQVRGLTSVDVGRRVIPFAEACALAGIKWPPPKPSQVDHPPHYNQGTIECIDAIEAALGREQFIGFLRGQIVKYTWRLGHKGDAKQDAEKAAWYQARLVQVLEAA